MTMSPLNDPIQKTSKAEKVMEGGEKDTFLNGPQREVNGNETRRSLFNLEVPGDLFEYCNFTQMRINIFPLLLLLLLLLLFNP